MLEPYLSSANVRWLNFFLIGKIISQVSFLCKEKSKATWYETLLFFIEKFKSSGKYITYVRKFKNLF